DRPARSRAFMAGEWKAGALARTVGQTDSYVAFAHPEQGGVSASRLAAFGRAERHSRRVRRLKVLLPALALAMMAGFAVYSFVATPGSAAIETKGPALAEGKLVMDSPKLEGFMKDGRAYSVSAA